MDKQVAYVLRSWLLHMWNYYVPKTQWQPIVFVGVLSGIVLGGYCSASLLAVVVVGILLYAVGALSVFMLMGTNNRVPAFFSVLLWGIFTAYVPTGVLGLVFFWVLAGMPLPSF